MSELGIAVVPYLIGWAIFVFMIGSTWHVWKYLTGMDDSHRQVHYKVLTVAMCSGFGLFVGGVLFFLIMLLSWGLEALTNVSLLELIPFQEHENKILFAACVQASTGMLLQTELFRHLFEKKDNYDH